MDKAASKLWPLIVIQCFFCCWEYHIIFYDDFVSTYTISLHLFNIKSVYICILQYHIADTGTQILYLISNQQNMALHEHMKIFFFVGLLPESPSASLMLVGNLPKVIRHPNTFYASIKFSKLLSGMLFRHSLTSF